MRGEPLRVVFTLPFGRRLGGAENVLFTFLRLVDRRQIEPSVIVHQDGEMVDEVRSLGIEVAVVPTGRFRQAHRMASATVRMTRLLRRRRPDLVVHWLNRAQVYGAPAAVLAGLGRRTMWFQRHLPDGSDPLDKVATRLPAIAIGTPSARAARAQATLLRPSRSTFYVHPGLDPPASPDQATLARLREEHQLPEDLPLVGIVGRLQRWKGQHRFLRALAALRNGGRAVHGVVVGGTQYGVEPEYAAELQRLTADLELTGHVTFTGQVSDASSFYPLLDVAVNASDEESFGLVLLEAMALGTPVVAFDHGGPSEIIEHGVSGVLVSSPEPDDLAAGIETLLDQPAYRARLTAAARARVEELFGAERMTRELERCIETLARGEVPASPRY